MPGSEASPAASEVAEALASDEIVCEQVGAATTVCTCPPEPMFGCTAVTVMRPLTAADLAVAAAREFQRVRLDGPGISMQPSRGWTLVNVDTIVFTDPSSQSFDVTLLGVPVTIEAAPARYSWDFGDGTEPFVTADPGAPYPNHSVAHVYRRAETRTIALTTTWAGRFRLAGASAWTPISGAASTTEQAPPIEVRQASNALVVD